MPLYAIELNQSQYRFPYLTEGYAMQVGVAITVTNTGQNPTGTLTVQKTGASPTSFNVSTTTIPSLPVGQTYTFTISPVLGLGRRNSPYAARVDVFNTQCTASVQVSLEVKAVPSMCPHPLPEPYVDAYYYPWQIPRADMYGTRPLYFRNYIDSPYWDAIINGTQGNYNGDVKRSSGLFYGWRMLFAPNVPEDPAKLVTDIMRAYAFSYLELTFANTRLFTYDMNTFDLRFRSWLMEWDIPFWRMIAALGYPFFSNMMYNNTASVSSGMNRSGTNQFSNSTGTDEQKQHESGGSRDGQALFLKSANENEDGSYTDGKQVNETSNADTAQFNSGYATAPQGERFSHNEQIRPTVQQTINSIFPQSAISVGMGSVSGAFVDPNFGSTLLSNEQMPATNLVYANNMQGVWSLPGPVDETKYPILDRTGQLGYSAPTASRAQTSGDSNTKTISVNELRNTAFQESLTNGITAAFSDRQDANLSKAIQSLISDSGTMQVNKSSAPNMNRMFESQRSFELARDQRPFVLWAQSFIRTLAYKRYDARHTYYKPAYRDKVSIPVYNKDTGGF